MTPKKPTAPKASKPAAKKPAAKPKAEPSSFMNWLGRQVGHVKTAVKTDVTKPPAKSIPKKPQATAKPSGPAASKPAATPPSGNSQTTSLGRVIYRDDKVEEAELPDRPGVILRRTIIDEVVVERETK